MIFSTQKSELHWRAIDPRTPLASGGVWTGLDRLDRLDGFFYCCYIISLIPPFFYTVFLYGLFIITCPTCPLRLK